MKRIVILLALLLLTLGGCDSGKDLMTRADDAIQTADDLIERAKTTRAAIEQATQRARDLEGAISPESLPALINPENGKMREMWTGFKQGALCAALKKFVQDGQVPDEEGIAEFLKEEIKQSPDASALPTESQEVQEDVSALATDVRNVAQQIEAVLKGDKAAYSALLIELECVTPP